MHRFSVIVVAFLCLVVGPSGLLAEPKGPNDLPERLEGLWKVSLCINSAHCWIRFEHVDTGEVHTVGRYSKGVGGKRDRDTGEWLWPNAQNSGLQWDLDLQHQEKVRAGEDPLGVIRDPAQNEIIELPQEREKYGQGASFLAESMQMGHARYSPLKDVVRELLAKR